MSELFNQQAGLPDNAQQQAEEQRAEQARVDAQRAEEVRQEAIRREAAEKAEAIKQDEIKKADELKKAEEAKAAEQARQQNEEAEKKQAAQLSEEYKNLIDKAADHAWERHGHEKPFSDLGITSVESLAAHMKSVATSPGTEYFEGSNQRLILLDQQNQTRMVLDVNGPGTCMIAHHQTQSFGEQYRAEFNKYALRGNNPLDFSPVYTVGHQGLPEITKDGFDFSKVNPELAAKQEALKQEALKQEAVAKEEIAKQEAAKQAAIKQEAAFKEQSFKDALARGADEESARKSAEERAALEQQKKDLSAAEAKLTARNTFVEVEAVMRKKEELREAQIAQAKAEAEREKRRYQGDEPLNEFEREAKISSEAYDKKSQMNLDWDIRQRKLDSEQARKAQEKRDRQAEEWREAAMREALERQRRLEMGYDPYYSISRGPRI